MLCLIYLKEHPKCGLSNLPWYLMSQWSDEEPGVFANTALCFQLLIDQRDLLKLTLSEKQGKGEEEK